MDARYWWAESQADDDDIIQYERWAIRQKESALEKITKYVHKDLAHDMAKCLIASYRCGECDELIVNVFNTIGLDRSELVALTDDEEALKERYLDTYEGGSTDEPEYSPYDL